MSKRILDWNTKELETGGKSNGESTEKYEEVI